jgi:16S rRNA processing protein RimM
MKAPASVRVGFIRRAVSLAGEVEVEPLGDNPDRFAPGSVLQAGGKAVTVERAHPAGGVVLRVKLAGIDDRDQAERLRGKYLEVDAGELAPLPEGQYYEWQLIGLAVFDPRGARLGRLEEVLEYPANDVYRVEGPAGEILIPAIRAVVREIDLEAARMVVDLPPVEEVK